MQITSPFRPVPLSAKTRLILTLSMTAVLIILAVTLLILDTQTRTLNQNLIIELPAPGSVLAQEQIFRVTLEPKTDLQEELTVFWSVSNGIRSGQMTLTEPGIYSDLINIQDWNWKRDHHYQIDFFATDSQGREVARKTTTVLTRTPQEVITGKAQPSVTDTLASVSSPTLNRTNHSTDNQTSTDQEPLTITPEPTEYNPQAFRFTLSGDSVSANNTTAFWQSAGGHRNLISAVDQDGNYQIAIDFSGWHWLGSGPYKIIFTIMNKEGSRDLIQAELEMYRESRNNRETLTFRSPNIKTPETRPVVTQTVENSEPALIPNQSQPAEPVRLSSEIFSRTKLYRPVKPAVRSNLDSLTNPQERELLNYIYQQAGAIWLNGDGHDNNNFLDKVVAEANQERSMPVFVLYNIRHRDCGSHSSGGARSAEEYRSWIGRITGRLSSVEAIFIIEPDALPQLNCLSGTDRAERLELISYAVDALSRLPQAHSYIDAGHPFWVSPEEMAQRLKTVGIDKVSGFALNVSNFAATEDNIRYGNRLSYLTDGSHYVIDTSRNGRGSSNDWEWCNPRGRGLGETPRITPNSGQLSAFLWIKYPGESDGQCNGGPSAGHWWLDYALELSRNRFVD